MSTRVLLDTNIWLDNYIPSRVMHAQARELISYCVFNGVDLLVAPTSITDVFYLLQRQAKQDARENGDKDLEKSIPAIRSVAWGCIENLLDLATVVPTDMSDIWLARKQRCIHDDLEDNVIVAAAERAKADCLVTNDRRLLRHAPVPALDVRDALAVLAASDPAPVSAL